MGSQKVSLYNMRIRKLQSDNWVICSGSCKRCGRCRRLYRWDEADVGGSRACSTWFDHRVALLNNSSSALSHKSLNVGVSGEQYPRRRARLITESMCWRADALVKPCHALAAYVRRATTVARKTCCSAASSSPQCVICMLLMLKFALSVKLWTS